jgi:hypothetical protein
MDDESCWFGAFSRSAVNYGTLLVSSTHLLYSQTDSRGQRSNMSTRLRYNDVPANHDLSQWTLTLKLRERSSLPAAPTQWRSTQQRCTTTPWSRPMNINTEADRTAFPFIVAALKGQTPASDSNLFFFLRLWLAHWAHCSKNTQKKCSFTDCATPHSS